MKPPLFLLLILAFCATTFAGTPYPVRDIDPGSDRFEKIFREVLKIRAAPSRNFKVLQTLRPGEYLVREYGGALYWLRCAEVKADGEWITGGYATTAEMYSYTAVTGAKATVKRLAAPEPYTAGRFLEDLRGGKTYTYTVRTEVVCPGCRGFSRVIPGADSRGAKGADGKVPCPECRGSGKSTETAAYEIRW